MIYCLHKATKTTMSDKDLGKFGKNSFFNLYLEVGVGQKVLLRKPGAEWVRLYDSKKNNCPNLRKMLSGRPGISLSHFQIT